MRRRTVIAILLALIMAVAGIPMGAVTRSGAGTDQKAATLMVYMTGSDLEASSAAATKDLQEMIESRIDLACANVVVYTGGAKKWHSDVPADANAVLELKENGFEQVGSFEQMSMGESESLTRFLTYAYENYPAETFYLILWDHGNGPVIGYCRDKLFGNDTLTLPEMEAALMNSPFSAENRLGFIGFDACLMASAELICTVGDYADYLIASQETEPNFGWDYAFLSGLGKQSPKELACSAADRYYAFCEAYHEQKPNFHSDVTMSVTDLRYADALREDVCALFRKATPDVLSRFSRIAVSRVNTRAFGRASTGSEYDLVDLKCLSDELFVYYPEETEALNALLDRMVVHAVSNTEQSCGVSLYYPFYNKNYYRKTWKDAYREMNVFPEYLNFLNRYEQMWLGSDMQELFDSALIAEPGPEEGTYFLPLSEEQLEITADARYYILRRVGEGLFAPIFVDPSVEKVDGGIRAAFDGNIIYYKDAFGRKGIPLLKQTNRIGTKVDYSILGCLLDKGNGGVTDPETKLSDIQIAADNANHSVEVKGIYLSESSENGKREEVDLNEWKQLLFMELSPRYLTRAENGRIAGFFDWEVYRLYTAHVIALADEPYFTLEPLYRDEYSYYILFELTDVQGNMVCSETLEMELPSAPQPAETEFRQLTLNESSTAVLQTGGLEFEFHCGTAVNGTDTLCMVTVHNTNDDPVRVEITDVSINGIFTNYQAFYMEMDAFETKSKELSSVGALLKRTGETEPIRFIVSAQNQSTYGTILRSLPVELVGLREKRDPIRMPILDAEAEEQILYSEGGIKVELLGLGYYGTGSTDPDDLYAGMNAYYRISNDTDQVQKVSIPALEVNGVQITTTDSRSGSAVDLQPHKSCYYRQSFTCGEVMHPYSGYYLATDWRYKPALIESLSSLSATVTVNSKSVRCPIELSQKGDGALVKAQGDLIYEDEAWSVYRDRTVPQEQGYMCLWLVSHLDVGSYAQFCTEDGEEVWLRYMGPNAVSLAYVKAQSENPEDRKLSICYLPMSEKISFHGYMNGNENEKKTDLFACE